MKAVAMQDLLEILLAKLSPEEREEAEVFVNDSEVGHSPVEELELSTMMQQIEVAGVIRIIVHSEASE